MCRCAANSNAFFSCAQHRAHVAALSTCTGAAAGGNSANLLSPPAREFRYALQMHSLGCNGKKVPAWGLLYLSGKALQKSSGGLKQAHNAPAKRRSA